MTFFTIWTVCKLSFIKSHIIWTPTMCSTFTWKFVRIMLPFNIGNSMFYPCRLLNTKRQAWPLKWSTIKHMKKRPPKFVILVISNDINQKTGKSLLFTILTCSSLKTVCSCLVPDKETQRLQVESVRKPSNRELISVFAELSAKTFLSVENKWR